MEKRKNKSQKESKQLRSFRSLEQECDLKEKRKGREGAAASNEKLFTEELSNLIHFKLKIS